MRWDAAYTAPFDDHPLAAIVLLRICSAICDLEKPPCLRAARAHAYTPEEALAFDALLAAGVLVLVDGRVVLNEEERTPVVALGSTYSSKSRLLISPGTRFAVLHRDGFRCAYCGAKSPEAVLHVDHVHPVSKGGTNDRSKLVAACSTCNLGKHARSLSEPLQ
jgi:hypothetical protein